MIHVVFIQSWQAIMLFNPWNYWILYLLRNRKQYTEKCRYCAETFTFIPSSERQSHAIDILWRSIIPFGYRSCRVSVLICGSPYYLARNTTVPLYPKICRVVVTLVKFVSFWIELSPLKRTSAIFQLSQGVLFSATIILLVTGITRYLHRGMTSKTTSSVHVWSVKQYDFDPNKALWSHH